MMAAFGSPFLHAGECRFLAALGPTVVAYIRFPKRQGATHTGSSACCTEWQE